MSSWKKTPQNPHQSRIHQDEGSKGGFHIPRGKGSGSRILKVRDQYLGLAVKRSKRHKKTPEDDRLFPFTETNARSVWDNAVGKAKLDETDPSTERRVFHPHVLRKFFRTRIATAIPVDMVEAMMGHEEYLTRAYRRHSEEELAEQYKRGEHTILIFETGNIEEVKKEMEEKMKNIQRRLEVALEHNREVERKVKELEPSLMDLALDIGLEAGIWAAARYLEEGVEEGGLDEKEALRVFEQMKKELKLRRMGGQNGDPASRKGEL